MVETRADQDACQDQVALMDAQAWVEAGMRSQTWQQQALELIDAQDRRGLKRFLRDHVAQEELRHTLTSPLLEERKVACVCCSVLDDAWPCQPELGQCLRHSDPGLRHLAEHALCTLWLQGGPVPEASQHLGLAIQHMHAEQLPLALTVLDTVLTRWPTYAEAHSQRAMLLLAMDRPEDALRDCERCVALNPMHFWAHATMGHCHLQADRFDDALSAYRRALAIHPGLDEVSRSAAELEQLLASRRAARSARPSPSTPALAARPRSPDASGPPVG